GASIFSPVESVTRDLRPRSMPTSPVPCSLSWGTSICRFRYQRPRASSPKLPQSTVPPTERLSQSRYRRPRKITVSPCNRMARGAWKGTHPRAFLPRHRGRLPLASREIANCLHTACTVSEWSPRSLLLPLVRLTRSKPEGQRLLCRRAAFWISPQ